MPPTLPYKNNSKFKLKNDLISILNKYSNAVHLILHLFMKT